MDQAVIIKGFLGGVRCDDKRVKSEVVIIDRRSWLRCEVPEVCRSEGNGGCRSNGKGCTRYTRRMAAFELFTHFTRRMNGNEGNGMGGESMSTGASTTVGQAPI